MLTRPSVEEMSTQPKDKSGPVSTLSVKANRPSLRISILSSFLPFKEPCQDQTAAMSTLLHGDYMASSLTDNIGIPGDSPKKKAQVQVVRFRNLRNSRSVDSAAPSSPTRCACDRCGSDQPQETYPNRQDRLDDTISSLLDSYLSVDANATHYSPSNYTPGDELGGEASEHCDDSFSEPYGAEDILELLYDSYLDEKTTSEMES